MIYDWQTEPEFAFGKRRTRRAMTDEFLAGMVARHRTLASRGLAPTRELAEEEGVGTSTVRTWLLKAQKRGLR